MKDPAKPFKAEKLSRERSHSASIGLSYDSRSGTTFSEPEKCKAETSWFAAKAWAKRRTATD